mmetsp:Transcript_71262/g.231559  ORF Transcript_71262/g.231559 Transcript_71262/m.231559 type:complete len:309 (-) Transcript_71262:1054-1980(-)
MHLLLRLHLDTLTDVVEQSLLRLLEVLSLQARRRAPLSHAPASPQGVSDLLRPQRPGHGRRRPSRSRLTDCCSSLTAASPGCRPSSRRAPPGPSCCEFHPTVSCSHPFWASAHNLVVHAGLPFSTSRWKHHPLAPKPRCRLSAHGLHVPDVGVASSCSDRAGAQGLCAQRPGPQDLAAELARRLHHTVATSHAAHKMRANSPPHLVSRLLFQVLRCDLLVLLPGRVVVLVELLGRIEDPLVNIAHVGLLLVLLMVPPFMMVLVLRAEVRQGLLRAPRRRAPSVFSSRSSDHLVGDLALWSPRAPLQAS